MPEHRLGLLAHRPVQFPLRRLGEVRPPHRVLVQPPPARLGPAPELPADLLPTGSGRPQLGGAGDACRLTLADRFHRSPPFARPTLRPGSYVGPRNRPPTAVAAPCSTDPTATPPPSRPARTGTGRPSAPSPLAAPARPGPPAG